MVEMIGSRWELLAVPAGPSRIELSEILGVHLLEVLLQFVRLESGIGRRLVGLDSGLIEQVIVGEDGSAEPQSQRDAVGGTRVYLEHVVLTPDQQLSEISVFLDGADDDPPQLAAQPHDDLL